MRSFSLPAIDSACPTDGFASMPRNRAVTRPGLWRRRVLPVYRRAESGGEQTGVRDVDVVPDVLTWLDYSHSESRVRGETVGEHEAAGTGAGYNVVECLLIAAHC